MKSFILFISSLVIISVGYKLIKQDKPVIMSELLANNPGIVIDVRTNIEWNSGHRNEALHYDWNSGDFQRESIKFDKTKSYYLYCTSGLRSRKAMEYMKLMGFKNVINLGGYSNLK